ncbi:MAG: phosphorylase [Nostocales cyanobacterium]|nr:MAG: phosphorylase [Nostocales cyanobacterium]
MINTILVPQGAEYQAVYRGLNLVQGCQTQVMAVPMGMESLKKFLQQNCKYLQKQSQSVLLMGLCGSLNQHYGIGDIVLYQDCIYQENSQNCHSQLTEYIHNKLGDQVSLVKGLTCDRVISLATEKSSLHQKFAADVVDMEGFTFLNFFLPQVSAAIVRVVSDDSHHDIPDLTTAIGNDGSLQPVPLAKQFIRQPLAAFRLIRGSLTALKILETTAYNLATSHISSHRLG